MYTTCSTLATDRVLVSILQSLEPHWRAQTCTQGVVHTAGGTIEVRGKGEEANQRSVYMTRNSYTHKKPSGGVSSPTPDMPSVWPGLTSETSKNHGYSIRS